MDANSQSLSLVGAGVFQHPFRSSPKDMPRGVGGKAASVKTAKGQPGQAGPLKTSGYTGSAAQAELGNQVLVGLLITPTDIVKQVTATANHGQKATA